MLRSLKRSPVRAKVFQSATIQFLTLLLLLGCCIAPALAQAPRSSNPILSGWYADPEARIFQNEYWIYPTYSAPYGEQIFMDAFSSKDLVIWKKQKDGAWKIHVEATLPAGS